MEPNRDQKSSNFGQVEGRHTGCMDKLRIVNMNLSNVVSGELTGEFCGRFDNFAGTVFEGRFVGYFRGAIESDFLNQDMYNISGSFHGKLTGRFVELNCYLDNLSNEQSTTNNAITQTNYPQSTVYLLPFRSIIPNPSDKKGVVNGKLYSEMRIARATFDKILKEVGQSPLQLDNLKGTFKTSCLAIFSGTFNENEYVETIRTFNGTVYNGLFNGQFRGFIEFSANMVCLSGTFSGNLVGNFVGSLDGVVSNRAVTV